MYFQQQLSKLGTKLVQYYSLKIIFLFVFSAFFKTIIIGEPYVVFCVFDVLIVFSKQKTIVFFKVILKNNYINT